VRLEIAVPNVTEMYGRKRDSGKCRTQNAQVENAGLKNARLENAEQTKARGLRICI